MKLVKERPPEFKGERDWEGVAGRAGTGGQYGSHQEDEEAASE